MGRIVEAVPHDHSVHLHAGAAGESSARLKRALALILLLMAGELAAGVIAHSLALLSDAGHMLTDAGAIGFSLLASAWRAVRPPVR